MNDDVTARRISQFCVGGAVAATCGAVAWGAFTLATLEMDPALRGEEYWAAVGERLVRQSEPAWLLVACLIGVCMGGVLMGRALLGRPSPPLAPPQ